MSGIDPLRVAIIGAGNIAGPYAEELSAHPAISLMGAADRFPERAEALAARHGIRAYPSVDALLTDPAVEAVVNLTFHRAHAPVSRQILAAGKHAYSEKPVAMTYPEARDLVDLAASRGLRLASAPSAFLGEGPQTAWKLLRDKRIGTVRAIYAEVNWGRIESWHPAPESFYDVGVMADVGIYPLSLVTAIYGPARRVFAYGRVLLADRATRDGRSFRIDNPEFVVAMIELCGGPVVRLTANWYVEQRHSRQAPAVEFHGDDGSLVLGSWLDAAAPIEVADTGSQFEPVPTVRTAERGIIWSRAVPELAYAIREGRPHRAAGDQAAHLVEIMDAIAASSRSGRPVDVTSDFMLPDPMDWAR